MDMVRPRAIDFVQPMRPILALAALIVFSGASFFFALAETSLFSLGKWQVRQLEERSPGAGKIISRLLSTPQDLLATLVLGNSFANAGIVAVMLWVVWRRDWPAGLVMFGVLWAVLVRRRSRAQNAGRARAGTLVAAGGAPDVVSAKRQPPAAPRCPILDKRRPRRPGPRRARPPPPAFPTPSTRSCSKPLFSRARWPRGRRRSFCKSSAWTAARPAT